MQKTLQVRVLHAMFVVTWFLFIVVIKFIQTGPSAGTVPAFFPFALGFVCVSEIGVALFLRERFIASAETVLRVDPENQPAMAKWRTGNLLSFCFAETITLFGLLLKLLGSQWKVAAIFFATGLLLLLLWTPRKMQVLPRGVR